MKSLGPTILLLLLSVCAASTSSGATLTVTKTADTNDGVCDANCSLREAVNTSVSGDTIVFSELLNTPQTITLTLGQITIDKNLTITGTGRDLVTVSGNNASRIFFITGAGVTVNISRITFRDGNGGSPTNGVGGAIGVLDSTLNASDSAFTNNTDCWGWGRSDPGSENSTILLSDLVVTGNSSAGGGAAVSGYLVKISDSLVSLNSGSGVGSENTLEVERCVVSGNSVVGVAGRHLTITDSTITDNTNGGVSGGDAKSTMTIERCLISGNSRYPGGGGVNSSGMAIIRDTQITNNTARADFGGGIANGGTLYLIGSLVSGNRNTGGTFGEDGGGGILTYGNRSLFVINSTVSGNTAIGNPGVGGGIYLLDNGVSGHGNLTVTGSTISNNQSRNGGGGIRIDSGGIATIQNSIIGGNNSTGTLQEDVSGLIISNGINLIGTTFGSSGWIGNDLLNVNPVLGPLGNNGGLTFTHALLPGSPAINAGNNFLAIDPLTMLPLTHDQRGRERIVGGTVDIGAYEASYSSSPVTVSGRITTHSGRGIERTRIKIGDGQGNVVYTQTNPFGYYRLNNLIPGTTYTITVTQKFYLFTSPQFFIADQDRDDLNFITGL